MPSLSDLVHETTTSTGTGNLTVTAVNGKRTFNTAFGTGGTDLFDYYISSRDAAEWERGTGHLSAATTFVRDTVLASSNAGAAVNFAAGTKDVTNDQPANRRILVDATNSFTAAQQTQARTNVSAALKGHIWGLTLSNNASDSTNDIDIAVGEASSTETNPVLMILASTLTKRLDASWAVGTNQGGLDTGSIADTTYHIWLIQRSDTGVVDALFSTSASAPTMPSNYDRKRRIGSIVRASAAIKAFVQDDDLFIWTAGPTLDVDVTNPGTSAVTRTLTVPTGIRVLAIVNSRSGNNSAFEALYLSDLSVTDTAASLTQVYSISTHTGAQVGAPVHVMTNTSAQIRSRMFTGDASTALRIGVVGWHDRRGRFG